MTFNPPLPNYPEDNPLDGNTPSFVPQSMYSMWMRRNYFTIMNSGDIIGGWDNGLPTQYPSPWYSNLTTPEQNEDPNWRYAYSGSKNLAGADNWEVPSYYKSQFLDSYFPSSGRNTQALEGERGSGPNYLYRRGDGEDIFDNPAGYIMWDGYPSEFKQTISSGAPFFPERPPYVLNDSVGGFILMSPHDIRDIQWNALCMQDTELSTIDGATSINQREPFIKVVEESTHHGPDKGSTAYFLSATAFQQDNDELFAISRCFAQLAYTTICSLPFINGQFNPQDGIKIKMRFKINRASQWILNYTPKIKIRPNGERYKGRIVTPLPWNPAPIEPKATDTIDVEYVFNNGDNPSIPPFGQKIHYSQPFQMSQITRVQKEQYEEDDGTSRVAYMKVYATYTQSIECNIVSVTNNKPFYWQT